MRSFLHNHKQTHPIPFSNFYGDIIKQCDCLAGLENIETIRTMVDERHEKYCAIVRDEITKGYRTSDLKLVRFDCTAWKCNIDVTACHILCSEVEIDRCKILKGLKE